ncbi:hypothetical protein M8818_000528 [Zalaria obscura]|uniref:Uncharacterized protein n=1 Tax=Zalaria obscura TaxID=2024903 RepID=A0ACC3SPT8_9PEZI
MRDEKDGFAQAVRSTRHQRHGGGKDRPTIQRVLSSSDPECEGVALRSVGGASLEEALFWEINRARAHNHGREGDTKLQIRAGGAESAKHLESSCASPKHTSIQYFDQRSIKHNSKFYEN